MSVYPPPTNYIIGVEERYAGFYWVIAYVDLGVCALRQLIGVLGNLYKPAYEAVF